LGPLVGPPTKGKPVGGQRGKNETREPEITSRQLEANQTEKKGVVQREGKESLKIHLPRNNNARLENSNAERVVQKKKKPERDEYRREKGVKGKKISKFFRQ